ncbi:hypothetical protein GCM10010922_14880 [Microbacterium sorbitolivorans]|nr:DUF6153 family protein [Microbacterium sorbitolivorans]GGF40497.1 hypothetical protein GCM10010922_14880 [Microbacterium sorbitolivorans]
MMGLPTLRERLPRMARWPLAVFFAAALIVGLMGMHTLASPPVHPESAASATIAGHHSEQAPAAQATDDSCTSCTPGADHHTIMTMCALALLLTALVFLAPGFAYRVPRATVGAWLLAPFAVRTAPRRPPSLEELSISRT